MEMAENLLGNYFVKIGSLTEIKAQIILKIISNAYCFEY